MFVNRVTASVRGDKFVLGLVVRQNSEDRKLMHVVSINIIIGLLYGARVTVTVMPGSSRT